MPDGSHEDILVRPRRWRVTLTALIRAAVAVVRAWRRRARERDFLNRMSDHELKDIGITRADANREVAKPFWRD
jgi:uncharacterized protein YjiS (DUF1127 family)